MPRSRTKPARYELRRCRAPAREPAGGAGCRALCSGGWRRGARPDAGRGTVPDRRTRRRAHRLAHPAYRPPARPRRADQLPRRASRGRRPDAGRHRAARDRGRNRPGPGSSRDSRFPARIPHRHRFPGDAGGRPRAPALRARPRPLRGGRGLRSAARLPARSGQSQAAFPALPRGAAPLLRHALRRLFHLGRNRRHDPLAD